MALGFFDGMERKFGDPILVNSVTLFDNVFSESIRKRNGRPFSLNTEDLEYLRSLRIDRLRIEHNAGRTEIDLNASLTNLL